MVSERILSDKGVSFKVVDDPTIDTTSPTGKLVTGILALIAEFENDTRRERQMTGLPKRGTVGSSLDANPFSYPRRSNKFGS